MNRFFLFFSTILLSLQSDLHEKYVNSNQLDLRRELDIVCQKVARLYLVSVVIALFVQKNTIDGISPLLFQPINPIKRRFKWGGVRSMTQYWEITIFCQIRLFGILLFPNIFSVLIKHSYLEYNLSTAYCQMWLWSWCHLSSAPHLGCTWLLATLVALQFTPVGRSVTRSFKLA